MGEGSGKEEGTVRKRKYGWSTETETSESKKSIPQTVVPDAAEQLRQQQLVQNFFLQQQQLLQQKMAHVAMPPTTPAMEAVNMSKRIYVGSLNYDLTEADLAMAFSPFGPVAKVDMPKDPTTGKHKGFCFIEFHASESAITAMATMNETMLAGRRIKVGRPNQVPGSVAPAVALPQGTSTMALLQAKAVAATISAQYQGPPGPHSAGTNNRLYVGSIYYDIGEEDVKAIFGAFGPIRSCQLIPNPDTGKHKGYGFIEYQTEVAARGAIDAMNGFELAGRPLKVGWASSSGMVQASGPPPGLPGLLSAGLAGNFPGMVSLATTERSKIHSSRLVQSSIADLLGAYLSTRVYM
eukprot:jgi/Mesen1/4183/ME000219S03314